MHLSPVSQSIATVLRGVVSVPVHATGDTDAHAKPFLAVTIEDIETPHPKLISGTLVLDLTFDADDRPDGTSAEATAAAQLQSAVDFLVSASGAAAIREAVRTHGIWLRSLRYPQPSTTTADGERAFTHQTRIPAWLQTGI